MTEPWIHPSAVLLLGAALLPFVPRAARKVFLVLVPVLAFAAVLLMQGHNGVYGVVPFMKWTLTFGRVDALSLVFAYIMTLMCIIGTVYGLSSRPSTWPPGPMWRALWASSFAATT